MKPELSLSWWNSRRFKIILAILRCIRRKKVNILLFKTSHTTALYTRKMVSLGQGAISFIGIEVKGEFSRSIGNHSIRYSFSWCCDLAVLLITKFGNASLEMAIQEIGDKRNNNTHSNFILYTKTCLRKTYNLNFNV